MLERFNGFRAIIFLLQPFPVGPTMRRRFTMGGTIAQSSVGNRLLAGIYPSSTDEEGRADGMLDRNIGLI